MGILLGLFWIAVVIVAAMAAAGCKQVLIGLERPAEHFYTEYCEEAERLLGPVWSTVEELAEALLEKRELKGHHVDRLVHGEEVLERPAPPI